MGNPRKLSDHTKHSNSVSAGVPARYPGNGNIGMFIRVKDLHDKTIKLTISANKKPFDTTRGYILKKQEDALNDRLKDYLPNRIEVYFSTKCYTSVDANGDIVLISHLGKLNEETARELSRSKELYTLRRLESEFLKQFPDYL
jgi:hypothetical protein